MAFHGCSEKNEILYKDVYDALLKLILITYKELTKVNLSKMTLTELEWIIRQDGHYQLCEGDYVHWTRVRYHFEKIKNDIPEYNKYSETINAKPEFARHFINSTFTLTEELQLNEFEIFYHIISIFFDNNKLLKLDKNKILSKYKDIENFILSEHIEYKNIIPLCGINLDSEELVLNENAKLIKLNSEQILQLFQIGIDMNASSNTKVVTKTYDTALVTSYYLPKVFEPFKPIDKLAEFNMHPFLMDSDCLFELDKLNIFLSNDFFPIGRISKPTHPFRKSVSSRTYQLTNMFMRNNITLSTHNSNDIYIGISKINHAILNGTSFLKPAIRRLGMATNRKLHHDRFIDLMVCIEILFIGSDGKNNYNCIKSRLVARCSKFFSHFFNEPKIDYESIYKEIYRIRSEIIHGSQPKMPAKLIFNRHYKIEDLVEFLQRDIRRTMIRMASMDDKYYTEKRFIRWSEFIDNKL
ncbi:HEPN domain-containing protein [Shewanella xiamenensis]|uniref:HEPN domain-containing protein n=1 Tax=Shewanella xiamenensis TaxID=332186 RepID=UPI000C12C4DF|nr:HEPN domain-containing protein [Shewanella xiamenensis]PHY63037.1 hypothetical protein CS023_14415 [Shewanella xiamenensis]